jgi:hypothetical protein
LRQYYAFFFVFFRLVVLFILLRFIFTVHIAQVKLKLKLALNAPLFELACLGHLHFSSLILSLALSFFSALSSLSTKKQNARHVCVCVCETAV